MGARHMLNCAPEQYTRLQRDSTCESDFAIAIAIGIGVEKDGIDLIDSDSDLELRDGNGKQAYTAPARK